MSLYPLNYINLFLDLTSSDASCLQKFSKYVDNTT